MRDNPSAGNFRIRGWSGRIHDRSSEIAWRKLANGLQLGVRNFTLCQHGLFEATERFPALWHARLVSCQMRVATMCARIAFPEAEGPVVSR